MTTQSLDNDAIRIRLSQSKGKEYWRSLEELADTPEFREYLEREHPRQAAIWSNAFSRRQFLALMGASLALAGLSGCAPATEKIVPYVRAPEQELVPGRPLFFATAFPLSGVGLGVLVKNREGRPLKIEGNPDHPISRGATDAYAQASILDLYDPDRTQTLTFQGTIRGWDTFTQTIRQQIEQQRGTQGAGLRILTETVTSPTLAQQVADILQAFPQARWVQWEPVNEDNAQAGAQLAFGQNVNTNYNLANADTIVSLDSDFLHSSPATLHLARQFADRRRVATGVNNPARLYSVYSTPTVTSANADHRQPLRPSQVEVFARALAARLGVAGVSDPGLPTAMPTAFVDAMVADLRRTPGRSVVIPGEYQPPIVHALAHAINAALGSVGGIVTYTDALAAQPGNQMTGLRELSESMDRGEVQFLVIIGGNPVYNAPADFDFSARLAKVPVSVHLTTDNNETSEVCTWVVPQSHYLETWGDVRAADGTVSIMQPLIQPLYQGRSAYELLGLFSDNPDRTGYDILRAYWQSQNRAANFDVAWQQAVHDGIIANSALPTRTVAVRSGFAAQAPASAAEQGIEVAFRPDPHTYDGRFNNNGWMQELPAPLSKLTWDNAALISVTTANRLGFSSEDVVGLQVGGRRLRAPIMIMPGQPDDVITLTLGYGRWRTGRVGAGRGYNAYALRTSQAPWTLGGVEVFKTGERYPLAHTQTHFALGGRDHVRATTFADYQQHPDFAKSPHGAPEDGEGEAGKPSFYQEWEYNGHRWGMAIDLSVCTGCSACVVACQAENNIPIVGKEQVRASRELHWLKIDHYYTGDPVNPDSYFQPRPCMQCEKAPCEPVCPVAATVHSHDGLNDMVYNRCVGTRYCSNNCPYKVRRFNYLHYANIEAPTLKMLQNPEVTVRGRGVMEKCTYCVQRIRIAEVTAKVENRRIREGEVITACAAACPTQAIVFGDINDPNSAVHQYKETQLNYAMLEELGTQPRTTYLGAVRNPNPALES